MNPSNAHTITIHRLTPAHLQDYLEFFDHHAFTDNPRWASCYCYFNQAPHHEKEWHERGAAENRAAASGLIQRGEMRGYLAYLDDKVVGWCNANARQRFTTYDDEAFPEGDRVGVIACFIVSPPYRKLGIARKLLDAAVQGMEQDGMDSAYVITRGDSSTDDAENHHGPLKIYLEAGFEIVEQRPPFAKLCKTLVRASS